MTNSKTAFPNPFETMMSFMSAAPTAKMPTMADLPDMAEFGEISRASLTAMTSSALAAAEGMHKMNALAYDTAQRTATRTMEAGHALAGVSEMQEATQLQQDFAKTAFQAYIEDTSAVATLFMGTLREAGKPLSDHASTLAKQVQGAA